MQKRKLLDLGWLDNNLSLVGLEPILSSDEKVCEDIILIFATQDEVLTTEHLKPSEVENLYVLNRIYLMQKAGTKEALIYRLNDECFRYLSDLYEFIGLEKATDKKHEKGLFVKCDFAMYKHLFGIAKIEKSELFLKATFEYLSNLVDDINDIMVVNPFEIVSDYDVSERVKHSDDEFLDKQIEAGLIVTYTDEYVIHYMALDHIERGE